MRIKQLVLGSAGVLALVLAAGGLTAYSSIDTIRIGGPLQTRGQETSDLIADILPPPEYIIESYLEATLLLNQPSSADQRSRRLGELRKQYDDRHQYWLNSNLDASVREKVSIGSHQGAMRFWQELDENFLPAAKAGDRARMEASYRRLTAAYATHRTQIDGAVAAATTFQAGITEEAKGKLRSSLTFLTLVALVVLAGVAGFCWLMLKRVVAPLSGIAATMKRMAAGDLGVAITGEERTDEVGEVARAMAGFKQAEAQKQALEKAAHERQAEQEKVVATLGRGLQRLADGDLTGRIEPEMPQDYEVLRGNYNRAVSSLGGLLGTMTHSADAIRTGSAEIATASEDLARRTEANAASLEETSAALTQVDNRLKTGADAASRTVERADKAIVTVSGGRELADRAAHAMSRVSESAKGIDSVIEGLDKIAFQTRVLAMNAAVEAGRAGEAGRGFAVVADLVGALAMRSEEEAKQARNQLTATQTDILTAVDTVRKMDGALADISADVSEVHELLAVMATDNQAQSRAVSEISLAISTMDRSTQQNAAMVEETSAAARNLTTEVLSLTEQARAFSIPSTPSSRSAQIGMRSFAAA